MIRKIAVAYAVSEKQIWKSLAKRLDLIAAAIKIVRAYGSSVRWDFSPPGHVRCQMNVTRNFSIVDICFRSLRNKCKSVSPVASFWLHNYLLNALANENVIEAAEEIVVAGYEPKRCVTLHFIVRYAFMGITNPSGLGNKYTTLTVSLFVTILHCTVLGFKVFKRLNPNNPQLRNQNCRMLVKYDNIFIAYWERERHAKQMKNTTCIKNDFFILLT